MQSKRKLETSDDEPVQKRKLESPDQDETDEPIQNRKVEETIADQFAIVQEKFFEPTPRPHLVLASLEQPRLGTNIPQRTFLPTDLAQIYNLPPPASAERAKIAVVSFGGGLFGNLNAFTGILTDGDCQQYWTQKLGMRDLPTVRVLCVAGARNNPERGDPSSIENTIDCSMIGSICPNADITLIIGTSFLNVLDAARQLGVPYVSVSWGFRESGNPSSYIQQVNQMLKEMSESGITVFCSSGDSGSRDGGDANTCDFPGSSPYVTCCGGTELLSLTNNYVPDTTLETVWNQSSNAAGGGGISATFTEPDYQKGVYANNPLHMRCVPDLSGVASSATAVNFMVGGEMIGVGGTSIVSPFLTAYCARIAYHKWSGNRLFNSLLYQCDSACFHDITQGNNDGFAAGVGYDCASGLGSIDGVRLQQNLMRLVQQTTSSPHPPLQPTGLASIFPKELFLTNSNKQQQLKIINGAQSSQWTTTDSKIATVDSTGVVTAVSNGSCFVGTQNLWCSVQVNGLEVQAAPPNQPPAVTTTLFVLPQIPVGTKVRLGVATVLPQEAAHNGVAWSSLQPEMANIDVDTGALVALKPGIVTFVGTAKDVGKMQSFCSLQIV